jgi:hypothetical protein
MAKFDIKAMWRDIKAYRQAYILTAVASFGGMVSVPPAVISGVSSVPLLQFSVVRYTVTPIF